MSIRVVKSYLNRLRNRLGTRWQLTGPPLASADPAGFRLIDYVDPYQPRKSNEPITVVG